MAVITPMAVADIDEVDLLERVCFPTPWAPSVFRRELEHNRFSFYRVIRPLARQMARELPAILAYGGCWLGDMEAHILTIASHPGWRRHKLGEWLLLALLAETRAQGALQVTLEVRPSNLAALRLYEALGFEQVGRRRGYYPATPTHPGEDALLYTLFALDALRVWQPLSLRLETAAVEANRRLRAG